MTGSDKARQLLASALQSAEGDIDQDAAIGITPQWDSLAQMRLILGLEEAIGQQLDMEQVAQIDSLAAVTSVLERHAVPPS